MDGLKVLREDSSFNYVDMLFHIIHLGKISFAICIEGKKKSFCCKGFDDFRPMQKYTRNNCRGHAAFYLKYFNKCLNVFDGE